MRKKAINANLIFALATLLLLLLLFFNQLTGFFAREILTKTEALTTTLGPGMHEFSLELKEVPEKFNLRTFAISGFGEGEFKIWLKTSEGEFLVASSEAIRMEEVRALGKEAFKPQRELGITKITFKEKPGKETRPGALKRLTARASSIISRSERSQQSERSSQSEPSSQQSKQSSQSRQQSKKHQPREQPSQPEQQPQQQPEQPSQSQQSQQSKQPSQPGQPRREEKKPERREREIRIIDAPKSRKGAPRHPVREKLKQYEKRYGILAYKGVYEKQQIKEILKPEKIVKERRFSDLCIESCTLPPGIDDKILKLKAWVSFDGKLRLSKIKYDIEKFEQIKGKFSILSFDGSEIPAKIKVYRDGELIAEVDSSEATDIDAGVYNIEIVPQGIELNKIYLNGFEVANDFDAILKIDTAWSDANGFAFKPLLPTREIKIESISQGQKLLYCPEWNFESRKCEKDFEIYTKLELGASYSINLKAGDLAISEALDLPIEKIQDDLNFDVFVLDSTFSNEEAIIIIRHNSKKEEPISVIGDGIEYTISKEIALPNEEVEIKIKNWSPEKYFEIHVGATSEVIRVPIGVGEILAIGATVSIEPNILDASDDLVEAEVEILNKEGKSVAGGKGKNIRFEKIKKGKYDFVIKPSSHVVEKIEVKGVSVLKPIKGILKLDNAGASKNFGRIFAIEVLTDFESADAELASQTRDIFKCANWDFKSRSCKGAWIKVLDALPGKKVNLKLGKGDPAFGELNKKVAVMNENYELLNYSEEVKPLPEPNLIDVDINFEDENLKQKSQKLKVKTHDIENLNNDLIVSEPLPNTNEKLKLVKEITFDVTNLNFEKLEIENVAEGNDLVSCLNFSELDDSCTSWKKEIDLIKGKNYSATIAETSKIATIAESQNEVLVTTADKEILPANEEILLHEETIDLKLSEIKNFEGANITINSKIQNSADNEIVLEKAETEAGYNITDTLLIDSSKLAAQNVEIEKVAIGNDLVKCVESEAKKCKKWRKEIDLVKNTNFKIKLESPGKSIWGQTIDEIVFLDSNFQILPFSETVISKVENLLEKINIELQGFRPEKLFLNFVLIDEGNEIFLDNFLTSFGNLINIDASKVKIESATITGLATSSDAFACDNFDFVSQICLSKWKKIKDLKKGQAYELNLEQGGKRSLLESNRKISLLNKEDELLDYEEQIISEQNGIYDIILKPKESAVQEILVRGYDSNYGEIDFNDIKLDTPRISNVENQNVLQSYAIDPTGAAISSLKLSAVAKGENLFKCKDFDFATQTCLGDWIKIKNLKQGESYTLEITSEDPAFVETSVAPPALQVKEQIIQKEISGGAPTRIFSRPLALTGAIPIERKIGCVENWICEAWQKCAADEKQKRNCFDLNACGSSELKPLTERDCCLENWVCSDWSVCSEEGFQTRECKDANACGTSFNKPETKRACVYAASKIPLIGELISVPLVKLTPNLPIVFLIIIGISVLIIFTSSYMLTQKRRNLDEGDGKENFSEEQQNLGEEDFSKEERQNLGESDGKEDFSNNKGEQQNLNENDGKEEQQNLDESDEKKEKEGLL